MNREILDPVKYCCEEAKQVCDDCVLIRLYPKSEKPCIDYALAMGRSIVRRYNFEYEKSLAKMLRG